MNAREALAYLALAFETQAHVLQGTQDLTAGVTKPPLDIFQVRPETNQRLGETIMKCLSRRPGDRPPGFDVIRRLIEKVESDNETS